MKKGLALLLMLCLLGAMLCACGGKKITAEEAFEIVLADLGDKAENAGEPHIHESTYKSYNIFVPVGDEPLVYVVSDTGEILHSGIGTHSH